MTRDQALARIDEILGLPSKREQLWDALTKSQRRAVMHAAGLSGEIYTESKHLHPAHFEAAWQMLERFANLSTNIRAANDQHIAGLVQRIEVAA
ncbi:MAG: hypothetical protein RLZZ182_1854 [Pseudomonadota bacterium]|jgi:hypothetical protein